MVIINGSLRRNIIHQDWRRYHAKYYAINGRHPRCAIINRKTYHMILGYVQRHTELINNLQVTYHDEMRYDRGVIWEYEDIEFNGVNIHFNDDLEDEKVVFF